MSTLSFDPDSGLKGAKAVTEAMVEVRLEVEQPLSRLALPAMPAEIRGTVARGLDSALATIMSSRASIAQASTVVKKQAQDLGAVDKIDTEISRWYKAGDAMVWAAGVTGTDVIYKTVGGFDVGTMSFESSDASTGEKLGSAASFALNFVPVSKLPAITRAIGIGGAKGVQATHVGAGLAGTGHLATHEVPFWFGGGMDAAQTGGQLLNRNPVRGVPWQQNPALLGHFRNQEAASQLELQAARVRGFGVEPGGAVLHSGVGGGNSAAGWAGVHGGTTLEMTEAGHALSRMTLYPDGSNALGRYAGIHDIAAWKWRMPAWRSSYEWRAMSTQFARQSQGSVRTVVGGSIREHAVLVTDELPALMGNRKVTDVTIGRPDRLGLGPIATYPMSRTDPPLSAKDIELLLRSSPDGFRLVFRQ